MILDREEVFGPMESEYLWCMHCERAYHVSKIRIIETKMRGIKSTMQMCAYEGCDGDTIFDGRDWAEYQAEHPMYPETPIYGAYYPLYPDLKE